jgi:thioredoxin 1
MVLGSDIPVLVDFWAPWCGPCLMVAPVLKKIAEEHAGQLRVVSLNADENPVTTMERSVLAMPTLQLYMAYSLSRRSSERGQSALIRELSSHPPALPNTWPLSPEVAGPGTRMCRSGCACSGRHRDQAG